MAQRPWKISKFYMKWGLGLKGSRIGEHVDDGLVAESIVAGIIKESRTNFYLSCFALIDLIWAFITVGH